MRLALLSDIHDHTMHLLLALEEARRQGCTHLLFVGDMVGASTFHTLREEWSYPIDLVLGNNEYELTSFRQMAQVWPQTTLHGYMGRVCIGGKVICFTHLPWDAHKEAATGKYDAVFYGHTHKAEVSMLGNTILANPGEIQGRSGKCSFAVYDTETNKVTLIPI